MSSSIGQPERATQNRIIALFRDELDYTYLGNREYRCGNSNIEEELLTDYLSDCGYSTTQISKAIYELRTEADNHNRSLYDNNKSVYSLLRYGVPIKAEAGENTETVKLINWAEPTKNDFAVAEEVTVYGNHEKRPDIVLYVNGITVGVLELKNSRASIGDGIRQSIVMVLLAKWILENNPNGRVVIVTDRDELDKQIEGVFTDAGVSIKRTSSGRKLVNQLNQATPRLLCSLVHKFGRRGVDDFEAFIKELESQPGRTVGEIFVFVDECHRTQSGKLHRTMKAIMPNAVFIGFTGTPLLKKDKQTSLEVFGGYIHTYKFSEAVEDEVVLDLVYEARDIDQRLGSEEKVDAWFDAKTRGLNDWQKAALREQWGTMQHVLSSKSRMDRVVSDIVFDFGVKPRLSNNRGNAILVASSIYEACKYYALFQKTVFKGKCAVVTSYNPQTRDITTEDTGANTETAKEFIYNLYTELLKNNIDAKPGMSKTETYEGQVKDLFKNQPANMKLLIVVDKLLTGFDAPSCTYLYIDKSMQDHGLFQAIY